VPQDHPDSNYRMGVRCYALGSRVPAGNITAIPTEGLFTGRSAAAAYEKTRRSFTFRQRDTLDARGRSLTSSRCWEMSEEDGSHRSCSRGH